MSSWLHVLWGCVWVGVGGSGWGGGGGEVGASECWGGPSSLEWNERFQAPPKGKGHPTAQAKWACTCPTEVQWKRAALFFRPRSSHRSIGIRLEIRCLRPPSPCVRIECMGLPRFMPTQPTHPPTTPTQTRASYTCTHRGRPGRLRRTRPPMATTPSPASPALHGSRRRWAMLLGGGAAALVAGALMVAVMTYSGQWRQSASSAQGVDPLLPSPPVPSSSSIYTSGSTAEDQGAAATTGTVPASWLGQRGGFKARSCMVHRLVRVWWGTPGVWAVSPHTHVDPHSPANPSYPTPQQHRQAAPRLTPTLP